MRKTVSYATLNLDPLTGGPTNMEKRVQMRKSMKVMEPLMRKSSKNMEPLMSNRSYSVTKHNKAFVPVDKIQKNLLNEQLKTNATMHELQLAVYGHEFSGEIPIPTE